jgi:hypothetical protein
VGRANAPGARRAPVAASLAILLIVGTGGCLGPTSIRQTRHRYNEVIQGTNQEELLLNLVRLRYNEPPSFLPVSGLNAQFELSAGADYRGGPERGAIDNFGSGMLRFADRPTLTFAPQRSPELTRALLTQVNLDTLYLFSREGWGPERVVRLFVRTINGIDNAPSGGGPVPTDPPEFAEYRTLSDLLASLGRRRVSILTTEQRSADLAEIVPVAAIDARDAVALKKEGLGVRALGPSRGYQLTQSRPVKVVQIDPGSVTSPDVLDLVGILGLQPYQATYDVEEAPQGQVRRGPEPHDKVTFTTRSILEVMYVLSKTVAVPEEHVRAGLAPITRNPDGSPFDWCMVTGDLFRVCVSKHRPKVAYVSVPYRGYWYSIDDRDAASKVTLNLFNELLRLQKTGTSEGQPVLTLPVGP